MKNYKEKLKKISAASLTDAMARKFTHRAHILDLKSPNPERLLFGEAAIINYLPFREDKADPVKNNFAALFYSAVGENPEGKVLVMGASGLVDTSLGGGTKLSRLHNHSMAGVLCEGRLRDWHELREFEFATYCAGETPRYGNDAIMPHEANVPIAFAGVNIQPGDHIYAYQGSAVVIPGDHLEEIIEEALSIEADDEKFIEQIRTEDREEILKSGSNEF